MMFYTGLLLGTVIGCCITAIVLAILKDVLKANTVREGSTHLHKGHINKSDHDAPVSISH